MPMSTDPDRIAVIVSCSQPPSSLLSQLRDAGMEVERTLDAIGIVVGTVARSRYAELSRVPDTAVETDGDVRIAPPGAPIQ